MGDELVGCMEAAKVALDSVLESVGASGNEALPEVDLIAFAGWLTEEVGSLKDVMQVVGNYGAYGGALGHQSFFYML